MIYLYYQQRKEGKANGKENKRAEKSGFGTYSARLRNWNSYCYNQNDYREYPVNRGGAIPLDRI